MYEYEDIIIKLRISIGDNKEECLFSDEQLKDYMQTAVLEYSKYKPIIRFSEIHIEPKIYLYSLASDYQTWIYGLQDYEIIDGKLYIENNLTSRVIRYKYYADRRLFEVPQSDLQFIADYCFYLIINDIISNKSIDNFKNNDNISALKLGRGLDLSFDNTQNLETKLYSMAESKKNNFYNALKNNVIGSWY